jgi:hypothetical protein
MSCCNDTVGTTIIDVPACSYAAGTMKIMLFPPPVPITVNVYGALSMMASMATCCTP